MKKNNLLSIAIFVTALLSSTQAFSYDSVTEYTSTGKLNDLVEGNVPFCHNSCRVS